MAYAANILPVVASGYTLNNATITNGTLYLEAGGSAQCTLTEEDIAVLSERFKVYMLPSAFTPSYAPKVYMYITVLLKDGTYLNTTCTPTVDSSGIYSSELTLEASEYESFTVTIYSEDTVNFVLWELCPEMASDISVIIDGVKQSLPKLLYDRNYKPFTIGQDSVMVANITYYLQQNTDLQGHFLLSYNASLACVLTLHFVDNDATELFSPLVYDLHAGRGSVGVPHSYLNRLAGLHNTYVMARVTAGTLTVGTCAMLFTLDGGYLAERLINLGTDVRDIAIKHTTADGDPEEVWTVGIDDGSLIVRKGPFSSRGVDFEPVLTISDALNAAIEFDGSFAIRNQIAYTIVTLEKPYVFFTDTDKVLYVQYGDDATTRTQLDTDVEAISACRGFKAQSVPDNDQGLICVYTKTNGDVYYRHYAYNVDDYYWLGPLLLRSTADALDVHVHRLNDYRVGIVVTTDDENIWYISDRTYVEQAVKPEHASYAVTNANGRASMRDAAASYPQTLSAAMTNHISIDVTSNYALYFHEPILDCISVDHGDIASASMVSANVLRITFSEPVYVNTTVSLDNFLVSFVVNNNYYNLEVTSATAIGGIEQNTGEATYEVTAASGTASMTAIITSSVSLTPEHAAIDLTSASGSVAQHLVEYINLSTLPEYAEYELTSASASAVLTKVGVEPI